MEFNNIVKQLRVQQRRVNAALIALVGTAEPAIPERTTRTTHTTKKTKAVRKAPPKFVMSPAARKKISISQTARWATTKAKAAASLAMVAHAANASHNGNNETATAAA